MYLKPKSLTFRLDRWYQELATAMGVRYLSPVGTFCKEGKCLVKVGPGPDEITTWDYGHLTAAASEYLIEKNKDLLNSFFSPQ